MQLTVQDIHALFPKPQGLLTEITDEIINLRERRARALPPRPQYTQNIMYVYHPTCPSGINETTLELSPIMGDELYGLEIVRPKQLTKVEFWVRDKVIKTFEGDVPAVINITDIFCGGQTFLSLKVRFIDMRFKLYGTFSSLEVFVKVRVADYHPLVKRPREAQLITVSQYLIFEQRYYWYINNNSFKLSSTNALPLAPMRIRKPVNTCGNISDIYCVNISLPNGMSITTIMPSELTPVEGDPLAIEFFLPIYVNFTKVEYILFEIIGTEAPFDISLGLYNIVMNYNNTTILHNDRITLVTHNCNLS